MVDYYSRYIEIARLNRPTTTEVVIHLKSIFARHGIPETLHSDNGPQYMSTEFEEFATEYEFQHTTSSPHFPQGNGEAERAVGIVKTLLKKSDDPYKALLAYRSTPLQNGYSPSQLLMGRVLRSTVPTTRAQREPRIPDLTSLRARDQKIKARQKKDFDSHHGARELSPLLPGDHVWLPERESEGEVHEEVAPQSYTVQSEGGQICRNRRDLIRLPNPETVNQPQLDERIEPNRHEQTEPSSDDRTRPDQLSTTQELRRSGRTPRPPDRLDPSW